MVRINKEACLGDQLCIAECPSNAIFADANGKAEVTDACIDCMNCITVCPADAILPE
jgi:NAD-dependent dihydropyrimidine dehydrogenase PreA subunit